MHWSETHQRAEQKATVTGVQAVQMKQAVCLQVNGRVAKQAKRLEVDAPLRKGSDQGRSKT